jgi:hypothetical protein
MIKAEDNVTLIHSNEKMGILGGSTMKIPKISFHFGDLGFSKVSNVHI